MCWTHTRGLCVRAEPSIGYCTPIWHRLQCMIRHKFCAIFNSMGTGVCIYPRKIHRYSGISAFFMRKNAHEKKIVSTWLRKQCRRDGYTWPRIRRITAARLDAKAASRSPPSCPADQLITVPPIGAALVTVISLFFRKI